MKRIELVKSRTRALVPDETDRGIMQALRRDGRATHSAIGAKLGLTEGTIRQRLRRLLEAGCFRIAGLVNPDVMRDHQLCVVGIKVKETRDLEAKAEEVSRLPEVLSVAIVTGRYDLLVEVQVHSNVGMIQFLSSSLAAIAGIERSETFLLLKSYNKWI